MPLSQEKQKQWMREYRQKKKGVIPNSGSVIPEWIVKPNNHLLAHMKYCPDYDPVQPGNHFEHCPFINPLLRPEANEDVAIQAVP